MSLLISGGIDLDSKISVRPSKPDKQWPNAAATPFVPLVELVLNELLPPDKNNGEDGACG